MAARLFKVQPEQVTLEMRRSAKLWTLGLVYGAPVPWTGPLEADMGGDELISPVPPERWPYGPPAAHEGCCRLNGYGLWCDCKASSAAREDQDFGISP